MVRSGNSRCGEACTASFSRRRGFCIGGGGGGDAACDGSGGVACRAGSGGGGEHAVL